MTDRLTALDATFLELEQADQSAHMHIGGVMVFEPRDGGPPSAAEVSSILGSRLAGLPRYRQRLSEVETGGLRWPEWIEDQRFDAASHIRRARLPGAGTDSDLAEWAGAYFSERLDRTRPLWELVILDGLTDCRWALVSKTHHCMVDGVGSVDAAMLMLDSERDPVPRPDEPEAPQGPAEAGRIAGLVDVARQAAELPLRALRAGAGVAAHPDRAAEVVRKSRALAEVVVRDEVIAAPRTSLNDPIGGHRRLGVIEADLDEVKAIKRALGGTVNDVVLAAATGALRRIMLARGEDPPSAGLRAMVPVNIRAAGDHLALGNRITSLFVHLPVSEADPLRRYLLQMEEAETLKAGTQGLGAHAIIDLAGVAPPVIHTFLARSLFATRLFNVTITNVPGPQMPLFAFGSKMLSLWPIVPLAAEHGIGIAIFSYDGSLFFCINADEDSVPDLDVLVDGIADSIDELSTLARDPHAAETARAEVRERPSRTTRLANSGLFI